MSELKALAPSTHLEMIPKSALPITFEARHEQPTFTIVSPVDSLQIND